MTGLVLVAITPFLFAAPAPSPVEVENLSTPASPAERARQQEEIEYRPPIEEDEGAGFGAFETQHQLQLLQQEVQQLRGLVEELRYQLDRMRTTQEDRYLELDSRFQSLRQDLSQASAASAATHDPAALPGNEEAPEVVIGSEGEEELYSTGLELIRNRQYDAAIEQLDALIRQFPDGKLTANAYYWLGEVHAAKPEPDYESARQALSQVIEFFPESHKVPDAAFKLGKVHHLMGDCERAEEILRRVMDEHSGKSVAKLAETYLRDKVNCDG